MVWIRESGAVHFVHSRAEGTQEESQRGIQTDGLQILMWRTVTSGQPGFGVIGYPHSLDRIGMCFRPKGSGRTLGKNRSLKPLSFNQLIPEKIKAILELRNWFAHDYEF